MKIHEIIYRDCPRGKIFFVHCSGELKHNSYCDACYRYHEIACQSVTTAHKINSCIVCKRQHHRCDGGIPCNYCKSRKMADQCINSISTTKRGRPFGTYKSTTQDEEYIPEKQSKKIKIEFQHENENISLNLTVEEIRNFGVDFSDFDFL